MPVAKGSKAQLRAYLEAAYGDFPVNGGVRSTAITAAGTGYTSAPTVTFSAAPAGGITATGTATIAAGGVTAVIVTEPGEGYSTAPTIAFSGGGGTGATATASLGTRRNGLRLPAVDIGIGVAAGLVQSRVLQGNRSQPMPAKDQKTGSGGTTLQPDVRSIGWILRGLLGGYSVTGPVNSLYTHTFTVDALNVSFMLEKFFSDLGFALQYTGCKPNGLGWEIGTGGLQECALDWVLKDEYYAVGPEDTAPLLQPIVGLKLPSVTLAQAGVALKDATRFGINIANNIEGTRTVGSGGLIGDAPEGVIAVSGGFEVLFTSMAQYNKARYDTEESLIVTYPAAAGMSLQFLIDEARYELASPGVSGPGGITQPMNYVGYYDDGAAASAIRAILVNDVVTYASIP